MCVGGGSTLEDACTNHAARKLNPLAILFFFSYPFAPSPPFFAVLEWVLSKRGVCSTELEDDPREERKGGIFRGAGGGGGGSARRGLGRGREEEEDDD